VTLMTLHVQPRAAVSERGGDADQRRGLTPYLASSASNSSRLAVR
jgi:hypothetical protein